MGRSVGQALVTAAIATALGPAGFTAAAFFKTAVIHVGLGLVAKALQPKLENPFQQLQERATADITTVSPIDTHKILYGKTLTGGTLVYSNISTSSSNYLNLVIALAPHDIEGIQKVYANSDPIIDLSATDSVISVTKHAVSPSGTYPFTFTLQDGEQFNAMYQVNDQNSITVSNGSTNILSYYNNTGGYFEGSFAYANETGSAQTITVSYSGTSKPYFIAWQFNFVMDSAYRDLIQIVPWYGRDDFNYDSTTGQWARELHFDLNTSSAWTSAISEWDFSVTIGLDEGQGHHMSDIAYIWARIKKDDKFQNQYPNISCVVKGKRVNDRRINPQFQNPIVFSSNPALILYDFLSSTDYGCSVSETAGEIDLDSFTDAADVCDTNLNYKGTSGWPCSIVNLTTTTAKLESNSDESGLYPPVHVGDTVKFHISSGVGSSNAIYNQNLTVIALSDDKRDLIVDVTGLGMTSSDNVSGAFMEYNLPTYSAHGIIDTAHSLKGSIADILSAMNGKLSYIGGKFYVQAGQYVTPSDTLTQDEFISGIEISPKPALRDQFNSVKGVYRARNEDFVAKDLRQVTVQSYVTEDGGDVNFVEFDLPMTTNPHQGRYLMTTALRRSRFSQIIKVTCMFSAARFKVGDTLNLTYSRAGISSGKYEIIDMNLNVGETCTVDLTLQETSSTVYNLVNYGQT